MFAKDKVTQSMLDAVNAVIGEAEKKATGKKPGWLIDAEKTAEAKEGKLKEDAEQIDEIDANAILAMAKKVSPTAKMRASSDEMKKDRDEKSAKQDAPKPHVPKSTFGDTKGYGQGRYMGDSVEVNDKLVENKDQRFIDAVSKVINGGKGVTVEEESLQEKDELRSRIGTNIVNKKPREGQTDLRNIPAGNRPDGKNKFSQGERDSQPTRLKNSIKASLGKHSKPNLPEEVEQMDEGKSFPATRLKEPMEHLKKNNPHDEKMETGAHRAWLNGFKHSQKETERNDNSVKDNPHYGDEHAKDWHNGFVHHDSAGESHPHDSQPYEKKRKDEFDKKWEKYKSSMVSAKESVENAFTAYKNKRPSEIGRHLTRTHDSKRLSDTSVMYTKKHGKDLDSAKDAAKDAETAHNATVFAKKKMNKEDAGLGDNGTNEEVAFEARDWVVKDPKTGADKAWGHESDWRPVAKPKAQGSGKASNLAGKALQKTKQMTKEDTGLDTPVPTKPKTTDTLAGRIKVPKNFHNQHVDSKVELKAESEEHPDEAEDKKLISKMIKQDDKKEEKKDTKKDIGLIKKYMHKEEIEHLAGNHVEVHSGHHQGVEGTLHAVHGDIFEIKPHGAESEEDHVYVPQKHVKSVKSVDEAFHGPEAGSGTGDSPMATNDSKPVKLAKYLAVKTADKMKNEMLGKMTN